MTVRPVAEDVLELDAATRAWDVATAHLSRGMGKAARRRIAQAGDQLRASAGRLAIVERVTGLDASPQAARAAMETLVSLIVSTGAIPWQDLVEIVNDRARRAPDR
ncbi:hypothetical protein D3874_03160 [Oleomonas cavernae]|uniref:Uncharacterized protein n=1 Tax=Oleomonas cavernae TaxID=2320859 RepID=A0A418WUK7_9PROT|nr:hypothetical protein [Oleomonas cavernae]RJF94827.1 hypothetical protein D3874_03160 [Oleomonas cavernae]